MAVSVDTVRNIAAPIVSAAKLDLEDVTAARAASRLTLDELATAVRGWFTD